MSRTGRGTPILGAAARPRPRAGRASARVVLHACKFHAMTSEVMLTFRATTALAERLTQAAKAKGVSRSEAIRAAVAEVLDPEGPAAA